MNLENLKHEHNFAIDGSKGEKKTFIVILITLIMMFGEIIGGIVYGSMALLADGWHMGTHVAAFGITIFAYRFARKYQGNSKFSFGAGKVTVLGGFASSVALFVVALVMAIESVMRLIEPHTIYYNNSILIAFIGLIVNGICAIILHSDNDHHHHHHHEHHHHDHNLKAAYMHVLADALTSITAIIGLFSAKYFGWVFMDSLMGIIGFLVISKWAIGLLKETYPLLLDEENKTLKNVIKIKMEAMDDNKIVDLHVWKISPHHHAAEISLYTKTPKPPIFYKEQLSDVLELSHILVEVNKHE